MSTATISTPRPRPPAVVVTGDDWEPQMLATMFDRGRITIETAAAGRLTYVWPINEFQAVAPQQGAKLWVVFDPIVAEELWVWAAPSILRSHPAIFLGVAEIERPEDADPAPCAEDHAQALASGYQCCPCCHESLTGEEVVV